MEFDDFESVAAATHPGLDRAAELALFRRFQEQGDARAADALVRAHLHHVVFIAQKYRRYGLSAAELVAEGNFGLVHALGKFDPSRGNRFMTYAAHWVRAYVIDYVIRSWSLVGGGSGALRSRFFFKLRRERSRIETLLGEGEAADQELARRLGVGQARLDSMLRRLDARDVSLDVPPTEGKSSLSERLPATDDQERLLSEHQVQELLHGVIHAAVNGLDARERYIVEHRLMADREDELSLAEIGRKLGVSRERARQLEERAKKKLRASINSQPAAAAIA